MITTISNPFAEISSIDYRGDVTSVIRDLKQNIFSNYECKKGKRLTT